MTSPFRRALLCAAMLAPLAAQAQTFPDRPIVIVVGSEGKGLSRLVTETCDQIVSIPISAATESLNAGIATSVALYEVSKRRAK